MNREELQKKIEQRTKDMQALMGDTSKTEELGKVAEELRLLVVQAKAMDKAESDLAETRAGLKLVPQAPEVVKNSGWDGIRSRVKEILETRQGGMIDISGVEKRAITANGAGYNTVPGIIRVLTDGGKLRQKVNVLLGKNSVTTVPVWSPTVAIPVGSVPGATGTASDSTAVLTGDPLTLKAWYSTIPISMGALISTDLEAELPSIFSDAFGAAIDKGICVGAGSGSDMLGVFIASASGVTTSQDIACAAAGAPLWVDYANMAMQLLALQGPMDSLAILVNPSVFNVALASAVAGTDPFKSEYLLKQTILGIPVILTSYALTTLTAGSYVAVGGYFKHYALAIAQEIRIDNIKTVGSDNVTAQAFMYMQGKPSIGPSFRRLKTV
jgi:HK97 family phage major capsid protein